MLFCIRSSINKNHLTRLLHFLVYTVHERRYNSNYKRRIITFIHLVTSSSFRVVFLVLLKPFGKSFKHHNALSTIPILTKLRVEVTKVPFSRHNCPIGLFPVKFQFILTWFFEFFQVLLPCGCWCMPTFKQLQNPFCALRRKVTEIRGLQSFKWMVVFPLYVHRTTSLAVYFDYHLKGAIGVLYSGRWVQVQFLLWIFTWTPVASVVLASIVVLQHIAACWCLLCL